VTLWICYGTL